MEALRDNRYNQEHYLDMTAYLAMGGYIMEKFMDGDIVKTYLPDGRPVYNVLLKVYDRGATAVPVFDAAFGGNMVKVNDKYVDLEKMKYMTDKILDPAEVVNCLHEDELGMLINRVTEMLAEGREIEAVRIKTENEDDDQEKTIIMTKEEYLADEVREVKMQAVKAQAQMEVYRKMYRDLLAILTGHTNVEAVDA